MTRIEFPRKPRKDGSGLFTTDGTDIIVGRDWAKQNDINDALARTRARACFKECRTCGSCANSRRDNFTPQVISTAGGEAKLISPHKSFDYNTRSWIDCRACEPYRFHDCHNGWMRDSDGDAEPFTEEAQKLFAQGGKPLI